MEETVMVKVADGNSANILQTLSTLSWGQRLVGSWVGHLHCPYRGRTHIHGGSEICGVVPGFRSAKPVAFGLVNNVMDAPRCVVRLVFQSFTKEKRCQREACAGPNFLRLLIVANDAAIRGHTVCGSHFSITELHNVIRKDFFQCRNL